jgi:hypothetical protein
MAAKE